MKHYLLIILSILMLSGGCTGCIQQKDMEFSASPCDDSIDPYDQSILGVKETTWSGKALTITVCVVTSCGDEIQGGTYQLRDDTIVLFYDYVQCKSCTVCVCAHNLEYTLFGLQKKEYQIKVKSRRV